MKKYKDLDTMFKEIEKERKEHPIKYFFLDTWRLLIIMWEKPGYIYREIIWFIQRGKRGYADCDVWDFDSYLSDVIKNGIKQLKEHHHGHSCWEEGMTDDEAEQKWNNILDDIIFTFTVEKKKEDVEWIYLPKKKQTTKIKKFAKDLDIHIMTKEERDRYNKGWFYFKKYFGKLWD